MTDWNRPLEPGPVKIDYTKPGPCVTLPVEWVEELLKMQDTADLMFVDFEIIEAVEREVEQVKAR